jgi:hypothetical protein
MKSASSTEFGNRVKVCIGTTRLYLPVGRFIDEIMASQRAAPDARKSHTQVETASCLPTDLCGFARRMLGFTSFAKRIASETDAFLCTLQGSSRGKGRLPIRQTWQTPLRPRRGSRKSTLVALAARCVSEARGPHGGSIEDITPGRGSTSSALAADRCIEQSSPTPSRYRRPKRPIG